MSESDREAVDAACRNMTASWVIEHAKQNPGSMETCSYYDNFQEAGEATTMPSGVYDLEELKKWGHTRYEFQIPVSILILLRVLNFLTCLVPSTDDQWLVPLLLDSTSHQPRQHPCF